ncbi:hypothetical protein LOD99_13769 [Oopsacas minuta]|uniref:Nucleotide-diphospho-sugar transferase domain-containing protein n=1 Tax=Oopsacas minuta TaxID=111878 RepID=A0AAV7KI46_9METZ|nr:hypothetical protein LOD99_13769 [Oopsacas minuta]
MDKGSCEVIQHFKIAYICINPPELLLHLNSFESDKTYLQSIFTVRMICFWLLSSWGFDILHFDVDAIPVRPKFSDLFLRGDEADIVAGIGLFPHSVYKNLGTTVCMGSFYLKSLIYSEGVRQLFTTMSTIDAFDDQLKMNKALVRMGLYWKSKKPGETWIGLDSNQRLRVNFLPETIVCRRTCEALFEILGTAKDELYIMHPFTQKSGQVKKSLLGVLNLWQLKTYDIPNIYNFNLDLIDFVQSIS